MHHSARTGTDIDPEAKQSQTAGVAEALADDIEEEEDELEPLPGLPEDPFEEAVEHLPKFDKATTIHSIKKNQKHFEDLKWAVHCYWDAAYKYEDIVHILAAKHNVRTSVRALNDLLKLWGWSQKDNHLGDVELREKVIQLDTSHGSRLGYRAMQQYLAQEGHRVSEKRVLKTLSAHNPENATARRSRRFKRRKYVSAGSVRVSLLCFASHPPLPFCS